MENFTGVQRKIFIEFFVHERHDFPDESVKFFLNFFWEFALNLLWGLFLAILLCLSATLFVSLFGFRLWIELPSHDLLIDLACNRLFVAVDYIGLDFDFGCFVVSIETELLSATLSTNSDTEI